LRAVGHEVRLMPAQYVKAYVKRNKNDAADAAAICEAVGRPSMRFVAIKTAEQQAALLLHRGRERLVRQRTQRHEGAKTLDRRHRVSITGAGDEFLLAATVQNLRKLARFSPYRPPAGCPSSFGQGPHQARRSRPPRRSAMAERPRTSRSRRRPGT
jgi:transposase